MPKFRVTYVRKEPAGVVKFDGNLEFILTKELRAQTPEQAAEELQRDYPWMHCHAIEQLDKSQ